MVYLAKCCHSDVSSVRRAEYPLEILNSADSFTMQNKRQQFCWTFFSISTSLNATIFEKDLNIDRWYQYNACLYLKHCTCSRVEKTRVRFVPKGSDDEEENDQLGKTGELRTTRATSCPAMYWRLHSPFQFTRKKILLRIWNMLRSHETSNYKAETRRCF